MLFQSSKSSSNNHSRTNYTWRGSQPLASSSDLCTKLDQLLHENDCSIEEQDRQCVELLRSITSWIKDHHPSNEELFCIGGRGGCVLRCLSEAATSGQWRVATAALQCLLELADHLPTVALGEESKSSAVAAGVQQEVTRLLQLHQQSPSIGHGEAISLALRVSHAMLLRAPSSLLPATYLAACRPFLFYGLPSYRSAVQDNSRGSILQEELDSLQSSECDQAALARPNYNNRNRRKRLRRKKTQPGQTVNKTIPIGATADTSSNLLKELSNRSGSYSRRIPVLPSSIGAEEQSQAKASVGGERRQHREGVSSHNAFMPQFLHSPDPSELNSLCLKPQWAMNRDIKGTAQNSLCEKNTGEESGCNNVKLSSDIKIQACEVVIESQSVKESVRLRPNYGGRSRDPISSSTSTSVIPTSAINSEPVYSNAETTSSDTFSDRLKTEFCEICPTKNHRSLEITETIGSNCYQDDLFIESGNPCIVTSDNPLSHAIEDESNKNNSSSDDDESGEQRVWSRSLLTARVRQSALSAVSSLVTVVGPGGKMSLWAPLLCQSPSLLHCLLTEPQAPGRAAILALLSLLLTDARQPLAAATDRTDRTAYSSLCHQLGSSLREMHAALGRVLVYERSSDAIVRTLKVIELLLDNVTYSKLAPGLLSGVVRMVRPYVTHSEAVVRANALSVLVSVLLVKPAPAEVPEMLLRYSPPGPRTNSAAALAAEDVLAHFTASSEDTATEWEEEEFLDQQDGPESKDVLSAVQAMNLETSTNIISSEEPSLLSTSNVCTDEHTSSAVDNAPQPPASSRLNSKSSRRTLLGWLVGQCVDALVPPPPSPHDDGGATRGVYVQVQLQSLKLLHALVTDHFSLVYSRLPVLQRVISHGCRASPVCGRGMDMAESGVVVEHMFPLLGAVLAVMKRECDNLLKVDTSEQEGGHHSCLVRRQEEEQWRDSRLVLGGTTDHTRSAVVDEEEQGNTLSGNRRSSGRRRDRELGGAVNLSDIAWLPLATSMWQWALQDPLRDLLLLPVASAATGKGTSNGSSGSAVGGQASVTKDLTITSNNCCEEFGIHRNETENLPSHETVADCSPCEDVLERALAWYHTLQGTGEAAEGARRQLVAAANTLSLMSQQVAENIGEQHLSAVLDTVLWLTSDTQPEVVAVWGVRVVGALCSLPAVQRSPLALDVVASAVVAGTRLLQDSTVPKVDSTAVREKVSEPFAYDPLGRGYRIATGKAGGVNYSSSDQQTAAAVNKHRLVAVSALANIAASLKDYSPRVRRGVVLPRDVTERLLEAAIVACDDKSKIRPHGVRCLGSALGWLREVAFREMVKDDASAGHSLPQAVTWLELSPGLCQRALTTLVECCSNGNNMKMRWNACHALGHLLHCPLPIAESQEWRGPVLSLLCSLVSSFPNYKVRIQASLALCGLSSRELYGVHYRGAWKALLAAATSSRNVTDFLEMRHLDDLVCQIVKGAWQLTALATADDCAWLQPLLLEQMPCLMLLLRRARSCLPPHCWAAQERALQHVTALLDGADALTDDEVAGLQLLKRVFGDDAPALSDNVVTAALLDGGTAFLAAPSTKTLP